MSINLSRVTLQQPQFEHGALATARLPFVQNINALGLARAATSVGMTQVATNQFQHPVDGSWAVLQGNRIERGVGNIHFRGVPADLMQLPVHPSGQTCAATHISKQLSGSALVANLTAAGFAETSKCFFTHPDGSWVVVTPERNVVRGFAQGLVHDADMQTGTAPPARRRTAARAPAPPVLDVMALPQRSPTFEDGFLACAMPGRLDAAQASVEATGLTQQGFVETHPGYFEHPGDKSWVAFTSQPSVERGVGGARFDRVPVNPTRLSQFDPNDVGHAFMLSAANQNLQALTLTDVQKSDAALIDAGFTRAAGPHAVYTHADGCFFAFAAGQTYVGKNQQILSPLPQPLDIKNAIASRPEHGFHAIAKTIDLKAGSAKLGQALEGLGFTATIRGVLYAHADGSWVVLQGKSLFRGVGTELLADVPKPPPPGSVVRDHSTPPLPASMRAYGLAKIGIVNTTTVHSQCRAQGFVQIGQEYVHADGSWVDLSGGGIRVGWKGYGLGDMYSVYQNGTGWV
jgi:predicted RNA binding protein YcfA (HicA-like mRNA interferase family)